MCDGYPDGQDNFRLYCNGDRGVIIAQDLS